MVFGNAYSYWWSGNLGAVSVPFSAADEQLSDTMQAYWATFAASGSPNEGERSTGANTKAELWPQMVEGHGTATPYMSFGGGKGPDAVSVASDYRTSLCSFWKSVI